MNKRIFSETILQCSYSLWRAVLVGERNLSYKKAKLVSSLMETSVDVWLDSNRVQERLEVWSKFTLRGSKQAGNVKKVDR